MRGSSGGRSGDSDTRGEGARAGRSREGEARSATVELAMNTETETARDGEQWPEQRGREAEGGRGWWLHAQSCFRPVLLRDRVRRMAGSCVAATPATCVTMYSLMGDRAACRPSCW